MKKSQASGFEALKELSKSRELPSNVPITYQKKQKPDVQLKNGSVIVRPVFVFNKTRKEIQPWDFLKSEKRGSMSFKASLGDFMCKTFVAVDPTCNSGVVCFIKVDEIPERGLIGFKVSQFLPDKKVAYVKPITGSEETLLSYYDFDRKMVTAALMSLIERRC